MDTMASGSVSMAEFSVPETLPNGTSLSPVIQEVNGDDSSPLHSSTFQVIVPQPKSHSRHSSADLSSPASENERHSEYGNGDSDMDAEGSNDEGYGNVGSSIDNASPNFFNSHNPPSPSSESSRSASNMAAANGRKRKADMTEHDYINDNAELFNLRRSGRARNTRMIVDDSDEDDDEDDRPVKSRRRATKTHTPTTSKAHTPRGRTSEDEVEDEDEEFYTNVRKQTSKKTKQRQKDVANGVAMPSDYQRFSSRRKAAVTSYNENEEDDEIDEDDVAEWEELDAEALAAPTIDIVLDHRIKEGRSLTDEKISKNYFEYLVKWQDKAHYHASWVNPKNMDSKIKGVRKLDNYFDKVIRQFIWLEENNASADEREMIQTQYQQKLDEYETNRNLERIVDVRRVQVDEDTAAFEYLVKWTNLHYKGCTWELEDLVNELAPDAIAQYDLRQEKIPQSNKQKSWHRGPTAFKWIKEQPSYIENVTMRDFQMTGLNFIAMNWHKRKNVILADEMGLGKTVQTVAFISYLVNNQEQEGLHLVVIPLSTLSAWQETFANWAPGLNVVSYTGGGREIIQDHEICVNGQITHPKCNVILTTREMIKQDLSFFQSLQYQFLAVDEAHILKNPNALVYTQLNSLNIPGKLLITGTPMQNTVDELQALLDFLNPGEIEAPEYYESLDTVERARILSKFKDAIRPYMLRRTKAEVEKDLPPKTEKILRVGMSPMQKEIYKHVFSRNYHALNENASKGTKATLLNITMELRKVANHPFLMQNVEDTFLEQFQGGQKNEDVFKALVHSSGKMVLLDRLLTKLKEEGHRVLIFTQLVSMLNIIDDYLNAKGFKHQRLDGTVSSVARRQAIDHFNKPGSDDFCFILSTRAGGLGINLATADRVILFDSDWNPHPDVQAMARAHRIGQTKPVEVYRFVSENTIEEKMLTTARNKLMLEYLVIQTGGGKDEQAKVTAEFASYAEAPQTAEDMEKILKQQAADIFKDDNTDKTQNLDIDAILASAEETKTADASDFRSSDGGLDFMKAMITSVSYDGSWESIIPKEKVEEIEREEKRREEEERLAELQGKARKRKAPAVYDGEHQREAKRRAKKLAAAQKDSDSDALSEPDDESDSEKDPNRPLSDKEWRLFIKAIEKHGAFNDYDATQKILKEGGLEGRALEVLNAAYEELVGLCRAALDEAIVKANEAGKPRHEVAKKERGAVLFKHHSSNRPLNVETILERAIDMRVVRSAVTDCEDVASFRVPDVRKAAKYTCEWGDREDAMLVVGIARHGFGAWTGIRDDDGLGLKDKMFLEENRTDAKKQRSADEKKSTPGAIHLHRRATYLIGLLRDREDMKQNGDVPTRKKKAHKSRVSAIRNEATENGSPAPHSSGSRPRSSSQSTPKPIDRPESRASNGSEKNARKAESELDRIPKKRRISDDGRDEHRHKSHDHHRRPEEKRENTHSHKSERRDRDHHRDRSRSPGRREEYRHRDDRKHADNAYRDERRRHYDRDRHDRERHDRDRHDRDRHDKERRHDNGHRHGSREEINGHRSHHNDRHAQDRPGSSSHRDRHDHRHDHRSSHNGDRHRDRDDRQRHKQRRDEDSRPKSISRAEKYILKERGSLSLFDDIRSGMAHMNANSKSTDEAAKESAQIPLQKSFYTFDRFLKKIAEKGGDVPSDLEFWELLVEKCFHKSTVDQLKALVTRSATFYAKNVLKQDEPSNTISTGAR